MEFMRRAVGSPLLWLVGVEIIALPLRLEQAWQPPRDLVQRTTTDDAYYYFEIARNVARGHNVTFDGETVTNGFHPLWLALITPLFAFDDGLLGVRLALTFGALLGAATCVLAYLTLKRLGVNQAAALSAAGLYAVHPVAVRDGVDGVESSLAVFFLAVAVLLFVGLARQGDGNRDMHQVVSFGLASGAAVLARTDAFIAVLAMHAWLVAIRSRSRGGLREPLLSLLVAGATITPWLVWSQFATGSVIQVSARAGPELAHLLFKQQHGDALWPRVRHGLALTDDLLRVRLLHSTLVPPGRDAGLASKAGLVALAAVGGGFIWRRDAGWQPVRALALVVVPAAGALGALVIDAGVRWHIRPWYFAPATYFAILMFGLLLAAATSVAMTFRPCVSRILNPGIYGIAVVATLVALRPWSEANRYLLREPEMASRYDAAIWLKDHTPQSTRVGAFNAGIVGYFSERRVINLDGVVNEDAYDALRNCRTAQYIESERLEYLVDQRQALLLASCGATDATRPAVVQTFDIPAYTGNVSPYVAGGPVDVIKLMPASGTQD